MPQTLSIGAIGAAVTELQNTLNQLPSKLAQLTTDGVFGQKTRELQLGVLLRHFEPGAAVLARV